MKELDARKVLLLQSLETIKPAHPAWSEEDAALASRSALTDLAAKENFQNYIVRRAEYAYQRIHEKEAVLANWLSVRFWHSKWILFSVPIGLLIGILINSVGSNQHINLLDPPLLAVVLWNIFTYVVLLGHLIKTLIRRNLEPGILVRLTRRLLRTTGFNKIEFSSNNIQIVQSFEELWLYCSTPLFNRRAAELLHALSASIALGLIAGLYLRGLVFDYRAAWESTFLSASSVHQILSFLLAPAIAISNITLPDVTSLDAMRTSPGNNVVGTPAAPWIHLYSLTLLLIIVLPRTVLMFWSMLRSSWIAHHMTVPLDNDYFKRLMRQYEGDTPPKSLRLGLISYDKASKASFISSLLGLNIEDINRTNEFNKLGSVYSIIETPHSEELLLWDTSDISNSIRIPKQTHNTKHLLRWLKGEIWNRWFDRKLWDDEQMAVSIRKDTDVLLHLVNLADSSDSEEYMPKELELLKWLDKPVIVLFNQSPHEIDLETSKIKSKLAYLSNQKNVKAVLALEEITSCWLTEDKLFNAIENALEGERRLLMARLRKASENINSQNLNASVHSIAESLARIANDFELISENQSAGANFKKYSAAIGLGDNSVSDTKNHEANEKLNARLESEIQENTLKLIEILGVNEKCYQNIPTHMSKDYVVRSRLNENKTTFWGGILTGAMTGFTADVLSGGLTLGGGTVAGVITGALGGRVLASSVNQVRGINQTTVMWSIEKLNHLLEASLLRYMVVIHAGHMKEISKQADSLSRWNKLIQQYLFPHNQAVDKIWKLRSLNGENKIKAQQLIASQLEPIVSETISNVLHELYPSTRKI